jgi:hypothetical protein
LIKVFGVFYHYGVAVLGFIVLLSTHFTHRFQYPNQKKERRISGACKRYVKNVQPYPTILVARDDNGLDRTLINCLERDGFHVLEASGWEQVFNAVRVHSRPIHVLLVDASMGIHVPMLKKHRSELQVVLVQKPVDADAVLAKVRQLLGLPPSSVR